MLAYLPARAPHERCPRPSSAPPQIYMPTQGMVGFYAPPPLVAKSITINGTNYVEGEAACLAQQVGRCSQRHAGVQVLA